MRRLLEFKNIYTGSRTGEAAAAFAYYILFSIFPVIGVANIVLSAFSDKIFQFAEMMPSVGAEIFVMYTEYIATYPGAKILSAIMVAFLYMPFRAMRFVLKDIRNLYEITSEKGFVLKAILTFVYTIVFIIVLAAVVIFVTAGSNILSKFLGEWLNGLIGFFVPAVVMFLLLVFLYKTATGIKVRAVYKGAMFSSVLWSVGSTAFSIYVNTLSNYSIVYGSLGSVMAMLVWIYFTCLCVLLGARVNLFITLNNIQRLWNADKNDI